MPSAATTLIFYAQFASGALTAQLFGRIVRAKLNEAGSEGRRGAPPNRSRPALIRPSGRHAVAHDAWHRLSPHKGGMRTVAGRTKACACKRRDSPARQQPGAGGGVRETGRAFWHKSRFRARGVCVSRFRCERGASSVASWAHIPPGRQLHIIVWATKQLQN